MTDRPLVLTLTDMSVSKIHHHQGLIAVANSFAASAPKMPLDVHKLFEKYLEASETVIIPRLMLLAMFRDLNRAWERTGFDQSPGSHGDLCKSLRDFVGNMIDNPSPFNTGS